MIICCDIDGVLADVREPVKKYLLGGKKDWSAYLASAEGFPVILPMSALLCALAAKSYHEIYLVTGRPESNRRLTLLWLQKKVPILYLPPVVLLMRPDNSSLSSHTCDIKMQWFRELKPNLVIDDDPEVVEAATREGFIVLQVHGFRVTSKELIPDHPGD